MVIQSPGLMFGRDAMIDIPSLSPRERVFGTIHNLARMAESEPDLNAKRDAIATALERASSWETELQSKDWPAPDRCFETLQVSDEWRQHPQQE